MKKNIVLSMCASLLFLASCDYNEKNFPGFDELTDPKDVQTITMDLADADYKTIAGLTANKELALSKDPEGQTFVSALEAMGKNKYFTEDAQAAWYLPAFINEKNPYLSDGSKVTINYNNFENLPEYLKDFNSISAYDLSAADYKKVWGEEISVSFLSPSTVKQIPTLLKEAVSKPADGAMRQVNYAYSETEPSLGGGGDLPDPEPTYTPIGDVLKAASGNFEVKGEVIAATAKSYIVKDATGSIRVYTGKLPNCAVGDVVVVSGDIENKQELNRFKSTSTYVIVDRSATFAYPAPTTMVSSDFTAYVAKPDIKYVTYEGTFKIVNGSYISYNVDFGGGTNVGSIVDPLIVDPSWDNAEVVVTGYLTGVSGSSTKYINTFITSIVLKSNTNPVPTPIGVIAFAPAGSQLAKGVVTAVHSQGFMLSDGTGSILVFTKTAPTVAVKDVVTVSGTTSAYQGALQFGNTGLTVNKVGTTDNFVASVPMVMDTEKWDMFIAKTHPVYATMTGSLKDNSGKYSVVLDGMPVAECNLSYMDAALIADLAVGDNVTVTGYLTGISGSTTKYGNIMVTSIAKATAANLRALAVTRAAAPQPTKSVVYRYDAAADAWKEYKATGAAVAVLQPADYNTMGAAYVSKPDETLPVYLQQTRPYAKKDDKVGVVYYKDSNKTIVIDEFVFDGATWTKTTVSTPSVIVFLKSQGTWVEAKVYYASSFLNNDDGGFTIQDVNLGDLKKVWSMDAKFGWKASAFSGGNKESESWIVSPEIDLKKSAAPVLKFDVAINYLNGEDRAKHFGVLVSTNYVDDVTTADWTELTVENWPEGTSWDFTTITPVDLSAYKDQTIRIAFRYKSDLKATTTAEVKNMSVQE